MFSWFKKLRRKHKNSLYTNGYEFGASIVLKNGWDGVGHLQETIRVSKDFGTYNDFDIGIEQSIRDFRRMWKKLPK